jgi:hypothetical protein
MVSENMRIVLVGQTARVGYMRIIDTTFHRPGRFYQSEGRG